MPGEVFEENVNIHFKNIYATKLTQLWEKVQNLSDYFHNIRRILYIVYWANIFGKMYICTWVT